MDSVDLKMLELLQKNSRITISELSTELALSRPSITERLHRLQEREIIEEFTARVSLPSIGREILLIIQVSNLKVSPQEFEELIRKDDAIIECHRVTGEVSYFLKAAVSKMDSMRLLIDRLIPYANINTSTVLNSPVPFRHVLPLDNTND